VCTKRARRSAANGIAVAVSRHSTGRLPVRAFALLAHDRELTDAGKHDVELAFRERRRFDDPTHASVR
jgi:hypothetical protein